MVDIGSSGEIQLVLTANNDDDLREETLQIAIQSGSSYTVRSAPYNSVSFIIQPSILPVYVPLPTVSVSAEGEESLDASINEPNTIILQAIGEPAGSVDVNIDLTATAGAMYTLTDADGGAVTTTNRGANVRRAAVTIPATGERKAVLLVTETVAGSVLRIAVVDDGTSYRVSPFNRAIIYFNNSSSSELPRMTIAASSTSIASKETTRLTFTVSEAQSTDLNVVYQVATQFRSFSYNLQVVGGGSAPVSLLNGYMSVVLPSGQQSVSMDLTSTGGRSGMIVFIVHEAVGYKIERRDLNRLCTRRSSAVCITRR